MKVVDVNILLFAINERAEHHAHVKKWWTTAINGRESIGLTWNVMLGFLRLSTNSRIFDNAFSVPQAIDQLDAWLSLDNLSVVTELNGHWRILSQLIRQRGTKGNSTSDAHLAALAISHGATLVSCDGDFSRYAQLRWENPIAI